MSTSTTDSAVGGAPAEGKITPEAIKAAENMVGMQLRPEGPYLQDATEDTIRDVCLPMGLVDVKVCAVDATWSGLKLTKRKALR